MSDNRGIPNVQWPPGPGLKSLLYDIKSRFLNLMFQYTIVGHCLVMARMNGGAGKSPSEL